MGLTGIGGLPFVSLVDRFPRHGRYRTWKSYSFIRSTGWSRWPSWAPSRRFGIIQYPHHLLFDRACDCHFVSHLEGSWLNKQYLAHYCGCVVGTYCREDRWLSKRAPSKVIDHGKSLHIYMKWKEGWQSGYRFDLFGRNGTSRFRIPKHDCVSHPSQSVTLSMLHASDNTVSHKRTSSVRDSLERPISSKMEFQLPYWRFSSSSPSGMLSWGC